MILGPAFVGAGFSTGNLIADIMNSKNPGLPKISFPCVDVRDVAKAHLEGLKRP
jgi:hypothetical protein